MYVVYYLLRICSDYSPYAYLNPYLYSDSDSYPNPYPYSYPCRGYDDLYVYISLLTSARMKVLVIY